MTPARYATPLAFKQALEQRLRTTSLGGPHVTRRRQLLVFDRFLARAAQVLGDRMGQLPDPRPGSMPANDRVTTPAALHPAPPASLAEGSLLVASMTFHWRLKRPGCWRLALACALAVQTISVLARQAADSLAVQIAH